MQCGLWTRDCQFRGEAEGTSMVHQTYYCLPKVTVKKYYVLSVKGKKPKKNGKLQFLLYSWTIVRRWLVNKSNIHRSELLPGDVIRSRDRLSSNEMPQ
jgi:hypothetical protein